MKKRFYLILIICILLNSYSVVAVNNNYQDKVKNKMQKIFNSVENNNLEEYLNCFSKNYHYESKNEHGTTIIEDYDNLKGRFPHNNDISKIEITAANEDIQITKEKAIYSAQLTTYTEYKNGLSYTKQDNVKYILINKDNNWLVICIN